MEVSSYWIDQFFRRMLMSVPTTISHVEAQSESHDDGHAFVSILILIPFCLLLGNLTRHLALMFHIPVPYTVILLVIGVFCGVVGWANWWGPIGDAVLEVKTMSPHLLLGVFIPPLLFESAFGTDYHVIRCEFVQALLLAGPGVIINTLLTALFVVYAFPYEWSWAEGITFGSIISATDPVAVVALLRDLGASKRLATLIEAESLLNDGSAFVLFVICMQFVLQPDDPPSGGTVFVEFCVLTFGGTFFGILFGVVAVLWLRSVFDDERVEIVITLLICYVCFWFCENAGAAHGLQMSGILGCVFLGLFVSKYKSAISPAVEESMHHFWEVFSYIANTLIFIFAGIIVFLGMIDHDDHHTIQARGELTGTDFLWLLVLFVVVQITRGLTILILWWPLMKTGYGISLKEGIVLTCAGLRGVIALSLMLLVKLTDNTLYPHLVAFEDECMFHVSGLVFISLAINGTFMKSIINALGLLGTSNEAKLILNDALDHLRRATKTKLEGMKTASSYSGADWEQVARALPVYADIIDNKLSEPQQTPIYGRNKCYYCCCYKKKSIIDDENAYYSERHAPRHEALKGGPPRALSASPQIYMSMDTFMQQKKESKYQSRRFGVNANYIIPQADRDTRLYTPRAKRDAIREIDNNFSINSEEKQSNQVVCALGAGDDGRSLDLPHLSLPNTDFNVFDRVIKYSDPRGHHKRTWTPELAMTPPNMRLTMDASDCAASACKSEIIHRVLQILKRSYCVSYERGLLSLDSFMVLEHAVDCALDDNDLSLLQEEILREAFHVNRLIEWAYLKYENSVTQFFMFGELALPIEVGKVFISALQEIRGKISCVPTINNNMYIKDVFDTLNEEEAVIKARWEKIAGQYPEMYNAIQTRHAVQSIIHHEANDILQLFNRGLFDESEYNKMKKLLMQTEHQLYYASFYYVSSIHDHEMDAYKRILCTSVLFLSKLSSDEKEAALLQSLKQPILKSKGEQIITANKQHSAGIYIIVSGTCALLLSSSYTYLSTGSVIGGYEYFADIPYLNSCVAKTSVALYFVDEETLRDLLKDEPQSDEILWKQCAATLILSKYHKNNTCFFAFYNETDINIMCQKSTFLLLDSEASQDRQLLLTQFRALILDGQSHRDGDDEVFDKMEIIMPHHKPYTFTINSRVLIFDYDPKKEEALMIRRRLTRRRKTM
eukprot:45468_1